jgi:hypothetical protein
MSRHLTLSKRRDSMTHSASAAAPSRRDEATRAKTRAQRSD